MAYKPGTLTITSMARFSFKENLWLRFTNLGDYYAEGVGFEPTEQMLSCHNSFQDYAVMTTSVTFQFGSTATYLFIFNYFEPPAGFEPATSTLQV